MMMMMMMMISILPSLVWYSGVGWLVGKMDGGGSSSSSSSSSSNRNGSGGTGGTGGKDSGSGSLACQLILLFLLPLW